ncbi:hypothetical protein [Vibrio jasicida]|uniref:hypothetical protein n=1 Tax=Vibrio jasicida TaxID=766224 RepID=UPI0005EEEB8C|nr:hypothetical protein [Vibrio jasicida]
MNKLIENKTPFVLFLLLVLGSSAFSAIEYWGDYVEKTISFVSSMVTFLVIVSLFGKAKGVTLFTKEQTKTICFVYVFLLVIEQGYPLYIYRDQTLPDDYFFIFSIQLAFNAFIAKVLLK